MTFIGELEATYIPLTKQFSPEEAHPVPLSAGRGGGEEGRGGRGYPPDRPNQQTMSNKCHSHITAVYQRLSIIPSKFVEF